MFYFSSQTAQSSLGPAGRQSEGNCAIIINYTVMTLTDILVV